MQTRQLAGLLRDEGITVKQVATNAPYRPTLVGKIPGLRALFRLVPYLFAVWRMAGKVDVIHLMANSGWSWQLYAAPVLWLARLRHTPVIVNYRGGEAEAYFQRSFSRVRPSLSKAKLIAVPSGYLGQVFARFGHETTIIPNIIDRQIFRPTERSRTAKGYTLVVTRNLEAIYGLDTALRALAKVRVLESDVILRVAGSGPEEARLRTLAGQLGVAEAVIFEGRLSREEIVRLYAEADAMINPTTVDNMPNSVMEALACGIPVISTNVGGVPFIISDQETGLLVPPNDPEKLAAAILRLKGDATLQQTLRANGLAQVEQYTWGEVRQKWLQAYAIATDNTFGGLV